MGRVLNGFALAIIALALISPWAVSTLLAASGGDAARVVEQVNAFRAAHGLAPVVIEARLSNAAQRHAEAMAKSGTLSHDAPDGSLTQRMVRVGYAFASAAENIGGGERTPEDAVAAWIQSPLHAHNLLVASVRHAGVGHATAEADAAGVPYSDYWCLILAEPAVTGH